jgi:transcriptional regulator with GAF, ATPase, and Fis domain
MRECSPKPAADAILKESDSPASGTVLRLARLAPHTSPHTPGCSPSFVELDEWLLAGRAGIVLVCAPAAGHTPIANHAARRLRASGWVAVEARARPGTSLFREVAAHLGVEGLPSDPSACADVIREAATARHAAVVAPLPSARSWDGAVARELTRGEPPVPLVFLAPPALIDFDVGAQLTCEVSAALGADDRLRWLRAAAEDALAELPATDLGSLEAWWSKARRMAPRTTEETSAVTTELSTGARQLLVVLALAGRSLPRSALARLAPTEDLDARLAELVEAGHASSAGGLVAAASTSERPDPASSEARISVAAILTGEVEGAGFEPDPWAFARAAKLLAEAGKWDRADDAMANALRSALGGFVGEGAALRRAVQPAGASVAIGTELAAQWFELVKPIGGSAGLSLRVKAAKRALTLGEAADAQRWCESAAALSPDDPEVHLLMARALVQLGDLVAARVCLAKAEAQTTASEDRDLRARVLVERAEVAYLSGELDGATEHASQALDLATAPGTRLAARGALGKVLLARGSWDLADAHFAEDALAASVAGEGAAELRARLNRAIALMSKGMLDEARALLGRVLADGTRLREERARAFALSNLGLVAYRQHDYGGALRYWEQTIQFPQALRGRLATALTIGNLADLRLRLGLVDHAEHAVAFGRRLLGGSSSPSPRPSALFKWVSAQIALARGDSELARREIEGAIVDAQASGDRIYLESAYVVAARVALEDGDLARAATALARAETVAKSPRARAEAAIVLATHRRAAGQPALAPAEEALELARTAGEQDLLFEIHSLLALLHKDAGDTERALAECARAAAIRDRVAAGLPEDVRASFLAKPEVVGTSRLQAALAADEAKGATTLGRSEPRRRRSEAPDGREVPRELVGDAPQIRNLALAVRKVAKSSSTVLIRGESGTGKELVAEALHHASDRRAGPLVSVNCAALVETLLLSELFGHEKGSFTGASTRRRGRFEMAEGGTLFLDEIGDISPRTQVALLRVLQEKTFERVGGATPIRADVRVVCATHRDLRAMVDRGEFREDLYYRLRGITLEVPPLRARLGDVPRIAEHLLARIAAERNEPMKRLSLDAVELLCRHRWPGNVRELENVLRAVVLFAEGDAITSADIVENVDELRAVAKERTSPPSMSVPSSSDRWLETDEMPRDEVSRDEVSRDEVPLSAPFDEESNPALPDHEASATAVAYAQVRQGEISLSDIKRQIERDCIARALAETKGNITRAAALLGMKRPRLSQLVKQYGLSATGSSEGNP